MTTRNKSEFTIGVTVCVSFSPLQTLLAVVNLAELICQSQIVVDEYELYTLKKRLNAIANENFSIFCIACF